MFNDCFNKLKMSPDDREALRQSFEKEFLTRLQAGDTGATALTTAKDSLNSLIEQKAAQIKLSKIKQAEKVATVNRIVEAAMKTGDYKNRTDALAQYMFQMDNLKALPEGVVSLENQIKAAQDLLSGQLNTIYEALSPEWFGLKENVEAGDMFIRALAGDPIKPTDKIPAESVAAIRDAAKVFRDTVDGLISQLRKEGVYINELEDWLFPQSWNQHLVTAAGVDQFIDDLLPRVDRQKMTERYLSQAKDQPEGFVDGVMTDDQLREFLRHAFMTIGSDGATKDSASSSMTNIMSRLNMQRQIHLKDTESRIYLHRKYSGQDMFSVVKNHLTGQARDVAIAKTLGSDPDAVIKSIMEKERADSTAEGDPKRLVYADNNVKRIKTMFGVMVGAPRDIRRPTLVAWMDTFKAMQLWKLAGSGITALFGDRATSRLTAAVNGISQVTLQRAELTFLNPMNSADKQKLKSSGIMFNHYADTMNRVAGEQIKALGWVQNTTKAQMRLSLMPQITAAGKDAFRFAYSETLGRKAKELNWSEASQGIAGKILQAAGMDEKTWNLFGKAKLSEFDIGDIIDPAAINGISDADVHAVYADEWADLNATLKDVVDQNPDLKVAAEKRLADFANQKRLDASIKLLGILSHEDVLAIVEPTIKQRTGLGAGRTRGTWDGELMNLVMIFKTFPVSTMMHHVGRAHAMGVVAGSGYATAMLGAGIFFGGLAIQVGNLLAGKELEDQTKNDFWLRALAKGNGIGYPVDLFVKMIQDKAFRPDEVAGMIFGPGVGDIASAITLAGKGVKVAQGKTDADKVAASGVRLAQPYVPFVNLPIARLIFERSVVNQLQEALNPGYAAKLKRDTEKNYGVKYWWEPAEFTPETAQ